VIWNDEFLFLHVPKTAGVSMTQMFLKGLNGKVHITGPFEKKKERNIEFINGRRHETLIDAESFFTYRNKSIVDFKKIFAVMRSPYDAEVSRYAYLRNGYAIDKGPAQRIAMEGNFKEYLRTAPYFGQFPPRLDRYFNIFGIVPANLVILKYERLDNEIELHLKPILREVILGKENPSNRLSCEEMYDQECEELCYMRHSWFFDNGYYSRGKFKSGM
jgi:hypothetical protein